MPTEDSKVYALLEDTPALAYALDDAGRLAAASNNWPAVLELTDDDELIGDRLESWIHPEDRERWLALLASTANEADPAELRVCPQRGPARWLLFTAPRLRKGLLRGLAVDLGDLRARYVEADQARARLRSVLETAPMIVSLISPEGIVEYINRSRSGISTDQIVGTHLLNWLPPSHREPIRQAFESVLAGEPAAELVVRAQLADESEAWFRTSMGPILCEGQICGVTTISEDVTDIIRARDRNAQLAGLEAVGRVAGAIAHDFNNMLTAMRGSIDLIELDLPTSEHPIAAELGHLREAVELTAGMVSQLLGAVRPALPSRAELELGESLRGLSPLLARACGGAVDFELELLEDDKELVVGLAEHELQQVLMNLVSNARDAIHGTGRVRVELEAEEVNSLDPRWRPAGAYAHLRVCDSGPGIPPAIRERIFEPFFTTKSGGSSGGGSGFGLATCHTILRSRGGEIWVECPSEGGTVVHLSLPLLDDPRGSSSPRPAPRRAPRPPALASDARLTILLAEDSGLSRSTLSRYLSRLGHRVLVAHDGEDALEVAARHPGELDVVLADLCMPRRDGVSLIRELRRTQPNLPALLISGYADPEQQLAAAELGVPVLDKPIAPTALLGALLERAGRPPAPEHAREHAQPR